MKITVRNLGPISEEAQFELKPLTIFIGPNNSGKTWLAYTLAAVFGRFGIRQFTDEKRTASILSTYPLLAKTIDTLLNTGLASINIREFAERYLERYFNDIVSCIRKNLSGFVGTNCVSFSNLQIAIELQETRKVFFQHILDANFHASIGLNNPNSNTSYEKSNVAFSVRKQKGLERLDLYITFEDQSESQLPHDVIKERIIWYIFRTLHHALFSDVIIQPTERTIPPHISMSYITSGFKDQIINPLSGSHKRPSSWPIDGYVSFIADILALGSVHRDAREREAQNNPQIQRYVDLAPLLEEHILHGKVSLSTPEPAPGREILFHSNDCPYPMEISMASSMVKQLMPLVFYLRSFAQPNELLIFDEPEMNLHPIAQVQMIEFLAMLVDAGINVLVTTHSPYMIDHFGNLTKASQHSEKERIQQEFYLQDSRAFIDENKVSIYFIGKGTAQDTLHNEELDWDTFGDVSDRLNEIYFSL